MERYPVSGTDIAAERERCAQICDRLVAAIERGLGRAHGPEAQRHMIDVAEWIATEIRELKSSN